MTSRRALSTLFQGGKSLNGFQTRSFFNGRNWDPFSDLNTALKEMERNSREVEKLVDRFGRSVGIRPPAIFRSIPVQGKVLSNYVITEN